MHLKSSVNDSHLSEFTIDIGNERISPARLPELDQNPSTIGVMASLEESTRALADPIALALHIGITQHLLNKTIQCRIK